MGNVAPSEARGPLALACLGKTKRKACPGKTKRKARLGKTKWGGRRPERCEECLAKGLKILWKMLILIDREADFSKKSVLGYASKV